MSLLTDAEKENLSIRRMIFHVVGKSLEEPILYQEIDPPQFPDFFLERVKSVLKGNLFEFKPHSNTERLLRLIAEDGDAFAEQTELLARDFQRLHISQTMSMGAFFVFELMIGNGNRIYALLKYDYDDVVRNTQPDGATPPQLELSHQNWVKKPEAMQKIALVRLDDKGGKVIVRDRSKPTHISEYFQSFLEVNRKNEPAEMSVKLVTALKETFKSHRSELSPDVQKGGINRIYEVLQQGGHQFDPEQCEPLITAIFGSVPEGAPLRKTFKKKLKEQGIAEETFEILPDNVPKPKRRRMETVEGISIIYDEEYKQKITSKPHEGGGTEIVIITAGIKSDDVDTEKSSRGH